MAAPEPIPGPIRIGPQGGAWLPVPGAPASLQLGLFVHTGMRLTWAPIATIGALLQITGGHAFGDEEDIDALAFTISAEGLGALIADLEHIHTRITEGV